MSAPHRLTANGLLAALMALLVGVSLAADDTPDTSTEDTPVAVINDFVLTQKYIDSIIRHMALGEQVLIRADLEKFSESLIQEEVLFQFALASAFDGDEELREEVKALVVDRLIENHVTSKLDVPPEAIEQFYNENTGAIRGETVEVSQILTETREECEALQQRLADGESFASLAGEYSLHERSASNGGVVGSIMNHDGPLGFEQRLFEIPQNEPTLFDSDDGCHIVVVTGSETPPLPPLENVAPAIEGLLQRELEIAALQALMDRAHSKVEVVRPE